jgi:hypothetical protein
MRKTITLFTFLFLMLALISNLPAQTPQYYNANSGGIGNTIPFNQASGYKSQWLIGPGEYNQPTPAPAGNITALYINMSSTGGPATFTQLTIKMGLTNITSFPSGAYSGQLDTVYYRLSPTLSSTANTWMMFTLDRPFYYNPLQSLVIEVSHCGFSGTGMNIWQTAGTTGIYRRNNIPGTTSCVFTYSSQDTRILQNGIDIVPVSSVNRCLLLPTPGVNTNYVMIPYATGMTGFQTITIEAWMKIGSTGNANTVLNKGAASFDYQLGVNASSALPFFRGPSVIATATFTMTAGVWTHLAVTSNGSTVIFYKNGVAMSTVTSAVSLGSSVNEMRIGRGNNDAGSGDIDEVRLWNIVRTPSDIAADMCNKWVPNSTTGLIGKWHFDSTYTDSVHGWNGTPMGNVGFDTVTWCPITGLHQNGTEVPATYILKQNYPNPFNPSTSIEFSIPKGGYVEMKLYDITGREVATLVSDPFTAGTYTVTFNGSKLASGVYLYKMVSGNFTETRKMVLIK